MTSTSITDARAALLALTPAQAAAVESLAAGSTHAEAAQAAGVSRETVSRWCAHHPGTRAALGIVRAALAEESAARLHRLRRKALERAEELLDSGDLDPLAVLRSIGTPAEWSSPPPTADELLDDACDRTARNMPRKPRHLADLDATLDPEGAHRAEAAEVTVARIANAVGLSEERHR